MEIQNTYIKISKNIIYCFIVLIFIACQNKQRNEFDYKLIEKISRENTELPSRYSFISFFGKCDRDKVALIFIEDLKYIHSLKYKKLSYLEFLKKTLNQEINIECQDKIECFYLDKEVTANYNKNDFERFLNFYVDNRGKEMELKPSLNPNQRNTISYYLFINNYLVLHDDYINKYYVGKTSSFYNL